MKKKLWLLALILLAGLLVTVLLSTDSSVPENTNIPKLTDSTILITEVCAKNESVIADNDGKYRDYIELYNSGNPICLKDFVFYDGKVKSEPLGDITLDTGEYRVFFISRSHTGFAISASGGDTIQLLDYQGRLAAQTNTATMNTDEVMLYIGGSYQISQKPSPGFANDYEGHRRFLEGKRVQQLPLMVNEILIRNISTLPDEKGAYSDVLELRNISEEPLELGRYFLSDDENDRFGYRLPQRTLQPGENLVLFCDGQNYIGETGLIHTNFGLAHGETLVLTAHTGEFVTLSVQYHGDDTSLLRDTEGNYIPGRPSLGYDNTTAGVEAFLRSRVNTQSALEITEVLLSSAGVPYQGAFCDVVEITNVSRESVSTAGWYLSDGGDPYAYPLPEKSLKPGESLVVCCDIRTTGFSLSDGEELRLTGPDYRHGPTIVCTDPEEGKSLSLLSTGENRSYAYTDVTLGYPNEEGNHSRYLDDQPVDDLRISEVMSGNGSYLKGPYGTTCDWMELYNPTDKAVFLSEYHITDSKGNLHKYPLPDITLEAGAYCVILLTEETTNLLTEYPVISMNLAVDGEKLYLSHGEKIVDYLLLPSVPWDMAYGRKPGSRVWSLLQKPTPGAENSDPVEITPMPIAVTAQGCYDHVEYVDVVLSGEGDIYYTTDCYAPTETSARYTGPIRLTKTTVLRVMCRSNGKLQSEVLDLTYLINENDHLPVVTVVASPNDLWSESTGIYVDGYNATEEVPHWGANYWMGWEKAATVSLFETDGSGFYANCGLKIFGNYSRIHDKKSLSLLFRSRYGVSELVYPLFGEDGLQTYESFILRSGGQDLFDSRIRDELVTSLVGDYLQVPVQDYRPVVVYLNGKYWGLHFIREKLTEHYLAGHYNTEAENMSVIYPPDGRNDEYWSMVEFIRSHDMSIQENYDYVCSIMDVDNFIDYMAAQLWIANKDLPGNIKYFQNPEGKWTWILFDADIAFIDSAADRIHYLFNGPERIEGADEDDMEGDVIERSMLARLLKHPGFRDQFLSRMAWQMNNVWTEDVVLGRIDEFVATIGPDMEKEAKRWVDSYESWEIQVEILRQFARTRNGNMLRHIQQHFDLTDDQMRQYGFRV